VEKNSKIYIAGHNGLVGSALLRRLRKEGYSNLITRTHEELNLLDQQAVNKFFAEQRPEYVFATAGKLGGIYANDTYRADFIYENLQIEANIIHNSFLSEVKKLLLFSCASIYPKFCPQPMKEEYILTGPLEPTNEPFAVAKIAGLKMAESYRRQYGCDFITLIPTNIYGPGQRYTPLNSLLIPALISKLHEAKEQKESTIQTWGTGRPLRDFLYSDDLADAAIFCMNTYSDIAPINIGTGKDISVAQVAQLIAKTVGYQGSIVFDPSMPEGVHVRLQDVSKISTMGWSPKISLEEGLKLSYSDYLQKLKEA
jgi:GDP-L-fucose synthase